MSAAAASQSDIAVVRAELREVVDEVLWQEKIVSIARSASSAARAVLLRSALVGMRSPYHRAYAITFIVFSRTLGLLGVGIAAVP
jgi:hypothetical protein